MYAENRIQWIAGEVTRPSVYGKANTLDSGEDMRAKCMRKTEYNGCHVDDQAQCMQKTEYNWRQLGDYFILC